MKKNRKKGKNWLLTVLICSVLMFADIMSTGFQVSANEAVHQETNSHKGIEEVESITEMVSSEAGEEDGSEEMNTDSMEDMEPQETESGETAAEEELQESKTEEATNESEELDQAEDMETDAETAPINEMSLDDGFKYVLNSSGTWYILKSYNGSEPIINIPDSLNGKYVCEIAGGAFVNYSGQHSVTVCIPAHMTTISNTAFGACPNITTIYVDPANTYFSSKEGVLYFHETLVRCPEGKNGAVDIPNGVNEIGKYAFSQCSKLESITIPESVEEIDEIAFGGCSRLTDIYYGGNGEQWKKLNVKGLDEGIKIHYNFHPEDYQYRALKDGTIEITGYIGTNKCVYIPRWLGGKRVTSIGDQAFLGSGNLGNCINIPESITNIGAEAFDGCPRLEYIYYAGSEEQWAGIEIGTPIKGEICYHCDPDRYIYVDLEDGNVEITGYNGNDMNITIPMFIDEKRVISIGQEAFFDSRLQSVRIPAGVMNIRKQAFSGCRSLESVEILNGVESIGMYAFAVCSSLERISIPESVTQIEEFTFNECGSLYCIDLPKSVTNIKNSAFNQCSNLKHIYFSGNKKQWKGVEIGKNNDVLLSAEIHYGDDTEEPYDDCRVSFNAWGVADIPDRLVKEYDFLEKPQDPVRPEYVFVGWYYGEKKWDFEFNKVSEDMILDARWEDWEKVSVDSIGRVLDKEGYMIWKNGSVSIFDSSPYYEGGNGVGYAQNSTTWSVSDSNVVALSTTSGSSTQVTAVSQGTAIVKERTVSQYYMDNALTGEIELVDTATTNTTWKIRVVDTISSIRIQETMELELNQSMPIECSTIPAGNYAKYVSRFEFISSDEEVAVVSKDGIVTSKGVGTAVITAKTTDEYGKIVCERNCQITVKNSEDIGDGDENDSTYDVTFQMQGHGVLLEEYLGYKDIKSGNTIKEPTAPKDPDFNFTGWYKEADCITLWNFKTDRIESDVILYAGWVQKSPADKDENDFGDILPEDIPSDGVIPDGIWSAGIIDKTYTAGNIKQAFRLYDGRKLLKEKIDYTVSYKNNKLAYSYTDSDYDAFEQELQDTGIRKKTGKFDPNKAPQIIIKMKGNYAGSQIIYFRIRPADITGTDFSTADLAVTYSGKKQTPRPSLLWNGKPLKYGTDFWVPEYDSAQNDKTAFSDSDSYPLTITGKNNFIGKVSVTLMISTGERQIAMGNAVVKGLGNQSWTGQQIKPADYTVKCKNKILSEDNGDYTVSFGQNTDVGTGTITFTGTGADNDGDGYSYVGTKTVSFKIIGTAMNKVSIEGVNKSYVYTGGEIEPEAVLTYKSDKNMPAVTLTKDVHYSVSYQKNMDKGTATVIFTGIESAGYTGTKKKTFKIVPDKFDGDEAEKLNIAFKNTENVQNGIYIAPYMKGGARPEVTVTVSGKVLEQDKDYKVSYINNKKVARSTDMKAPAIIIQGKGNYVGIQKICFTIEKKALSNENGIIVVANDKTESGKKNGYRQNFKVYDADGKLLGKNDYDTKNVKYTLLGEDTTVLDKDSVVPAGSIIQISVQGKGAYEGGTATGSYRILKNGTDISKAIIQINDQIYDGEPVLITDQSQFKVGKVYVKNGRKTKTLILGKDIKVVPESYVNNTDKGTAKVTFQGINGYGGTKTVTYKIGVRSIEEFWKGIWGIRVEF